MTWRSTTGCWWLCGLVCLWSGCTADPAPVARAAGAPSHAEPTPEHPLERRIHARIATLGMKPHGAYLHGALEAGGKRDHLLVLQGGRCYRVVAAAGPGVQDLDLVLYDEGGRQLRQDRTTDPEPMLGDKAEICPERGAAFRLQVRAYQGAGPYALRVLRSGD